MKGKDVQVGECHLAKVSGKPAKVRITAESPHGGWEAVNTATNRPVRIRGAGRLTKEQTDAAPAQKMTKREKWVADMRERYDLPPAPATTPEVVQDASPTPTDATGANVGEPGGNPAVQPEAELSKEADILWMHPFTENTNIATHLVWPGCIAGSEVYRVVRISAAFVLTTRVPVRARW
jgi:hypothetical protein